MTPQSKAEAVAEAVSAYLLKPLPWFFTAFSQEWPGTVDFKQPGCKVLFSFCVQDVISKCW